MPDVWTNWAGDQRCAPRVVERPLGEGEVAAAVERARRAGERLRVAGSGHSFTDIACTDGHLLDLSRMDRVLDSDAESGLVRVQAGITLRELGPRLAERGLAMENQGDIDAQSLAGAIATATHGTGAGFPNLSAQVVGLRLVGADAAAVELTPESDPDGFLAARVALGALGAVTEVTLRCVPLFTIRRVDEPRPLGDVLERLDELVDGHDHFELYVFPYTGVAIARESERTDAEPRPESAARLWLQERVLENAAIALAGRIGRARPQAIPAVNRGFMKLLGRSVKVDRSHRVYASRREVRFTEMEYAIPRAAAREALERVLDTIERRRLPVGFPLEMRFTPADDALLSTAHGRETAYVAVHQFRGMEHEAYFRAVERIMDDYGGRPHWGKRHYQSAATLAPRYPEWERFQAVRARLDPEGLFSNDYTDRVLGRVGAPVGA